MTLRNDCTLDEALANLDKLTVDVLRKRKKLREHLWPQVADLLIEDQRENQILYYRPAQKDAAKLHRSVAREFATQGGNKSSKTGTMLADAVMQMIGLPDYVPAWLRPTYPKEKLRGHPIRVRLVVTSLLSAWDANLKQKLQWFHWNGKLNEDGWPGDPRFGHWGFVPRDCLIDGDWDKSWSEKHRILQLVHPMTKEKWSTLEVMSHSQDLEDFNQGAYHLIVEDEIPPEEIHRANKIRAMEMSGQILTGGTPSDDRTNAVIEAWFFDQILAPGLEGSNPGEVEAVVFWTEHNRTLSAEDIAFVAKGLTPEQRRARLHGEAIHLSGLIIKGFTEKPKTWCFVCVGPTYVVNERCESCGTTDLVTYAHVWDDADVPWPGPARWPVLFYMDPHQSKPTACAWFKVDPQDNLWQIAEAEIQGDAATVKREVEGLEAEHGWMPLWRKGDPKITAQTNQFAREVDGQPFNIARAFEEVGFDFEPANTNFTVAIERIEQALRPNPLTRTPRFRVHRSCARTVYQLTHFTWVPPSRTGAMKEQPSKLHSDFPAVVRYLHMDEPTWRQLQAMRRAEPLRLYASTQGRGVTGW
jgi:hypothetical protein